MIQSRTTPELRFLFWETTAGCNLECIHCRRLEVSSALSREDLTFIEGMTLLEDVASMGDPMVILSGGEPLYRPDIFDLARHGTDLGLRMALATNGTLVDRHMARRIVETGAQIVSISVDGADPETHDRFRQQPGAWDAALRGIAHLRAEGMPVQLNSTITRHNAHQLDDLYRLAQEVDVRTLYIFLLVPVGCGLEVGPSLMLSGEEVEAMLSRLFDFAREGKLHIRATCAPQYFRILHQRAKEVPMGEKRSRLLSRKHRDGIHTMTRGCLAGTAICFVSHKGQVFPCGYFPIEAGNVRNQPLSEIWAESGLFRELRNPEHLKGKCGACEFKRVCGGCRARAYAQTGDYLTEEPTCTYVPGSPPPVRSETANPTTWRCQ